MQLLRRLSFTALLLSLMTLVACGGGSGGDLTGGDTVGGSDSDVLTIALTKSEGDLSGDNPITIRVTVMQSTNPVANKLVTFALTGTTAANATLSSSSMATGSDGIAEITVSATGGIGGVEITGSITVGDSDPLSATGSFNSIGGGVVVIEPGDVPVADNITLLTSSQQLASSGAQAVTLIAIAKDGNNNLLKGVKVNFSADSGSLEELFDDEGNSLDITGVDGRATRTLSTLGEQANRIVVTEASSGQVSDLVEIQVLGTTVNLTGSSSLALDAENAFVIKVADSDGNSVKKGTIVTLSLSNLSTESQTGSVADITLPNSIEIDSNGQASIIVIGNLSGTNTIIASALGATTQQEVTVQADSFLFSSFGDGTNDVNPTASAAPDILLSKTATVTLTWLRSGVTVPDGTEVEFSTTRGVFPGNLSSSSATTIGGKVTTTITSTNAGIALLTFTGKDSVNGKTIALNNQFKFEFVADVADKIIAQAFPQSIGPNNQTSIISVVVRDPQGNLVKDKVVDFVLTDPNSGEIEPAWARTDSSGSASTVYTSTSTSAKNGVSIKATVRDMPSVSDTASLTVADREVFIKLGTGNSIENTDETTYNKKYSVYVTDIDSKPVPNVTLTISAIPSIYVKGVWIKILKDGEFDHYATQPSVFCANEDIDNDSILSGSEDFNGDGRLTPGNIVNALGEVTTDEKGRAIIDIEYAEVYGHWAYIDLIASTKVNGTESFDKVLFILPVAGEDVTNEGNPPATFIGGTSPFGSSNSCSNPN